MNTIVAWVLKGAGIAIAALGVFLGVKFKKIKADSPIEQMVEAEIKQETGLTVDLSPEDVSKVDPSKTEL